jgi:hypothetical protein
MLSMSVSRIRFGLRERVPAGTCPTCPIIEIAGPAAISLPRPDPHGLGGRP